MFIYWLTGNGVLAISGFKAKMATFVPPKPMVKPGVKFAMAMGMTLLPMC